MKTLKSEHKRTRERNNCLLSSMKNLRTVQVGVVKSDDELITNWNVNVSVYLRDSFWYFNRKLFRFRGFYQRTEREHFTLPSQWSRNNTTNWVVLLNCFVSEQIFKLIAARRFRKTPTNIFIKKMSHAKIFELMWEKNKKQIECYRSEAFIAVHFNCITALPYQSKGWDAMRVQRNFAENLSFDYIS